MPLSPQMNVEWTNVKAKWLEVLFFSKKRWPKVGAYGKFLCFLSVTGDGGKIKDMFYNLWHDH